MSLAPYLVGTELGGCSASGGVGGGVQSPWRCQVMGLPPHGQQVRPGPRTQREQGCQPSGRSCTCGRGRCPGKGAESSPEPRPRRPGEGAAPSPGRRRGAPRAARRGAHSPGPMRTWSGSPTPARRQLPLGCISDHLDPFLKTRMMRLWVKGRRKTGEKCDRSRCRGHGRRRLLPGP